jgi:hypothetical protein
MNNPLEILKVFERHLDDHAEVTLFGRSAAVDLILTKMARGDSDDLADIEFLLTKETISPSELQRAFSRARVPNVTELQELFAKAQPRVLALAKTAEHNRTA